MNRYELIDKIQFNLGAAQGSANTDDHEHYAEHMQAILNLLIEELVGSAPGAQPKQPKTFNPEQVLEEIAIAIKHRTYSLSERWNIVYYHERLTCIPSYIDVPPEIILQEFTERMVHRGFTTIYWHQLKLNVMKFYKELET